MDQWTSTEMDAARGVDRLSLSRLIRYGLHDLSARNGHHAFEELCRFLVAERIVSNVYPATGPVAAGGDAGRDFQTFQTYIQSELGPNGGFAALASDEPVAFACTLQAKGVPSKIRRDLKRIAAGPPVGRVFAMVAADVPAAKAEELKREALEQYGITLEILDGQALAELLAHHDTFWIAARWLAVPAEYAPERPDAPDEPEWYVESRDRWRAAESGPMTMGELIDVRAGLRRATFHAHARPDLGMWLARMAQACEPGNPPHVRQRARYETAVAQLRGAGDLRPAEGHVIDFLGELDLDSATWAELMDASVLVQYVTGAALRCRTGLDVQWITFQNSRLRKSIERRLRAKGLSPTQKAGLLEVLGHVRTHTDLTGVELPTEPIDPYDPIDHMENGAWAAEPIPSSVRLVDADGAVQAWLKFARLAPKAPLAPVDSLSMMLSLLAPVLVDRPGYRELVRLVDDLVADVAGNSAAAERSRDRAFAFLRDDRPLDALAELHEAKFRWWRGDTMRGTLLALLMLARCYNELGLLIAARQHALAAVGLAHAYGDDVHGDLIAAGLMKVAHLDYRAGAWCAATESYWVAMFAHIAHQEDPWNPERHEDLTAAYLHGGYIRATAEAVDPRLAERVRRMQEESGLSDVLEESAALIVQRSALEWRDDVVEQLGVVPFADAGPDRLIQWSALGLVWQVRAVNTYGHCRAAERFAAAAQILCAELAHEDLVLLPTTIRVRVQAADGEQTRTRERVRSQPSNEGSDWIVDLLPLIGDGSNLDPLEVGMELMLALTMILHESSLVPWAEHKRIIERASERGLPHKLSAGRPYDDLAGVIPRQQFDQMDRQGIRLPREWRDIPNPEPVAALTWSDGPGPGYSREKSEEMIRNRYRRSRELLRYTIPRLAHDPSFAQTYQELIGRGWKDWHVLLALTNARVNFRIASERPSFDALRQRFRDRPQHPVETPDEPPMPADWLTLERLEQMRRFGFVTGAPQWGLEIHQDTPDFQAIEEVLGRRYGYWSDDVPHPPLFVPAPGSEPGR